MDKLTSLQAAWWLAEQVSLPLAGASTHFALEVEADEATLEDPELDRLERAWSKVVGAVPVLRTHVSSTGAPCLSTVIPQLERLDLRRSGGRDSLALAALRRRVVDEDISLSGAAPFRFTAARLDRERWWLGLRFNFALLDYASILQVLHLWKRAFRDPDSLLTFPTGQERTPAAQGGTPVSVRPDLPPAPSFAFARDPRSIGRPSPKRRELALGPDRAARLTGQADARGLTLSEVMYGAFARTMLTWADGGPATFNLATFDRREASPLGDACVLRLAIAPALEQQPLEAWLLRTVQGAREGAGSRTADVLAAIRKRLEEDGVGFPVVFTDLTAGAHPGGLDGASGWLGARTGFVTRTPQVWVDCQFRRDAETLVLSWDYPDDLFDEVVLASAFEGFQGILDALIGPEIWQTPVDLVCAGLRPPREQVAHAKANDTRRSWPSEERGATLCSRVLEQARRTPAAPAVIGAQQTLCFRELVQAAAGVAAWVDQHTPRPGRDPWRSRRRLAWRPPRR